MNPVKLVRVQGYLIELFEFKYGNQNQVIVVMASVIPLSIEGPHVRINQIRMTAFTLFQRFH